MSDQLAARSRRAPSPTTRRACGWIAGSSAISPSWATARCRSCCAPARSASTASGSRARTGSSPARPSACRPASPRAPPPKPREIPTGVGPRRRRRSSGLVIHRDDQVIVLNKPPGLAVQGGTGTERHVDGMLDALRFGFEERPRLVHRLDKDTSGLLLIARTGLAAKRLGESFRDRETEKLYWAVVVGMPPRPEGAIDLPLAKRPGARDRETDAGRPRERPEGADPFQDARPCRQARRAAGAVAAHRPHASAARALRGDRLPHPGRRQVRRRGSPAVGRRRCRAGCISMPGASCCRIPRARASWRSMHSRRLTSAVPLKHSASRSTAIERESAGNAHSLEAADLDSRRRRCPSPRSPGSFGSARATCRATRAA